MRRFGQLVTIVIPVAVLGVTIASCSSSASKGATGATASSAPTSAAASGNPKNITDVGDVASLAIAQDQTPTDFNQLTLNGQSLETSEFEEGTFPSAFRGQVDNTADWDRNLLASEPKLVSSSPEVVQYDINPKAVWSDNVPIDVADFQYTWNVQTGKNPAYMIASSTGYDQISKIEGSNAGKTVTVTFSSAFGDWRSLFSPILPSHLLEPLGVKGFNDEMVGGITVDGKPWSGGPYIQQSYDSTSKVLVLVPNPAYWGPVPHVKKLVFSFGVDAKNVAAGVANGEIDVLDIALTAAEVTQLQAVDRVKTINYGAAGFEHLDFNFKNPLLAQLAVRKAIATAVDTKGVISRTVGQIAPSIQPLGNHFYLAGFPHYVDHATTDGNAYGSGSAVAADKILEAAGWKKSGDYYAKDGKTLEVHITTSIPNDLRVAEETVIQSQLKAAGIKLDIGNTTEGLGTWIPNGAHSTYTDGGKSSGYDIGLFSWVDTPFVSGNKSVYSSLTKANASTSQNTQGYSNPRVDALLAQAVTETDPAKAAAEYNQADQLIFDDMATLPLFQEPITLAYPKTLANVHPNPTTDGFTYNVGSWGAVKSG